MKRAVYDTRGPVPHELIRCVEAAPAPVGAGEARVQVLAAPINPSDVLTLTGQYGLLPPLPAVGGNEGVGRVVELGEGVAGLAIGQTVLLPIGIGTWSTEVVAPAKQLLPLPEGADPRQLAMLTVNPPTARLLLSEFLDLQPGEWVLQNAANSAVGGYLIQLAKARGLKTANIVRREDAMPGVLAQGGDVVLLDGPELGKRLREATGGARPRLGIDAVGGGATERLAQALAEGGTVVNYGAMGGERCEVSPNSLIFRDITLRGFWLSKWLKAAGSAERAALFTELAQGIARGELSAPIQASYPLEQVAEAVRAAAGGGRSGKILIEPNGPWAG